MLPPATNHEDMLRALPEILTLELNHDLACHNGGTTEESLH